MGRKRYLGVGRVKDLHLSPEVHLLNLLQKAMLHACLSDLDSLRARRKWWYAFFSCEAEETSFGRLDVN